MQLSKKAKIFSQFLLHFWTLHEILNILEKDHPHSSIISEVIDSERHAYLNA